MEYEYIINKTIYTKQRNAALIIEKYSILLI